MAPSSTPLVIGPDISALFSTVDPRTAAVILFYLVLAFVVVYGIVAVYHWMRYSSGSAVTIPAIMTHLFVSIGLILFAISGLGL